MQAHHVSRQYVIRKLLIMIPSLLGISVVLFSLLALAPGDPFDELATNPAVPPEVRAARRAYQKAHAARAKAGKALRALSPALMRRAVDLARKHATAAQRIYTTVGGAHPDAPTLKSLAHRTAAAYAAALSLAARLDAPTPTTTPTPESKTP